jgi:hypothetical protein
VMRIINRQQILVILCIQSSGTAAFSFQTSSVSLRRPTVSSTHAHLTKRESGAASVKRYSSQWDDGDDDDDDDVTTTSSSFDQAKEKLKNEDDLERLISSGDFDANPSVS